MIVVVIGSQNETGFVYDLDSLLSFPCSFGTFVSNALRPDVMTHIPLEYSRMYRVIPAIEFIRHFASDRSHMVNNSSCFYYYYYLWIHVKQMDGFFLCRLQRMDLG